MRNRGITSGCLLICLLSGSFSACGPDSLWAITTLENGGGRKVTILIEAGPGWIHDEPVTSPPTFALWIEDPDENFIETLYVTEKAAQDRWRFDGGTRRPESLPAWSHRRGVLYSDDLYMPDRDNPLPDAVTSATPKAGAGITTYIDFESTIVVFLEINHSCDWNDSYPEIEGPGDSRYSGESGQPALVYRAEIDPFSPGTYQFSLYGTSSSDGGDGRIRLSTEGITSALKIVDSVSITVP